MENFNISLSDKIGNNFLLEALHDTDFDNRTGYDKNFLGIEVPLPQITDKITDLVGTNPNPSANGANYLDYTHFSILFNKSKKLPFATAVNIQGLTNELGIVHETRDDDTWYQDNRIFENIITNQFNNNDYRGSGFQKGHMVRYYDPAWGENMEIKKKAIGDTFHFTNCCPQLRALNVGDWLNLENYTMARALFQDEKVTVFSGPIFKNALHIEKLLVPVNFWKIVVYKKENTLEAIGFLLSQQLVYNKMIQESLIVETDKEYSNPTLKKEDIDKLFNKKNLKGYMVKIEELEEKTGLSFGLNSFDLNKNKNQHFFEKLVPTSPLPEITERFKGIMKYIEFNESVEEHFDDAEFIKNM